MLVGGFLPRDACVLDPFFVVTFSKEVELPIHIEWSINEKAGFLGRAGTQLYGKTRCCRHEAGGGWNVAAICSPVQPTSASKGLLSSFLPMIPAP